MLHKAAISHVIDSKSYYCQKHLELSGLCTMAFVRFFFPWVTVLGAEGEQERHPWFG